MSLVIGGGALARGISPSWREFTHEIFPIIIIIILWEA